MLSFWRSLLPVIWLWTTIPWLYITFIQWYTFQFICFEPLWAVLRSYSWLCLGLGTIENARDWTWVNPVQGKSSAHCIIASSPSMVYFYPHYFSLLSLRALFPLTVKSFFFICPLRTSTKKWLIFFSASITGPHVWLEL